MFIALKKFWRDEEGVTMMEYGIIAAMLSIAAIIVIAAVGGQVNELYSKVASEMEKLDWKQKVKNLYQGTIYSAKKNL